MPGWFGICLYIGSSISAACRLRAKVLSVGDAACATESAQKMRASMSALLATDRRPIAFS